MSLTYGFFNSLNHDRRYDAKQMSAIFDGIINDGIFMSIGNQFMVKENDGMVITVEPGRAWFNSTWTLNDAPYLIEIDEAEIIIDRIDAVVLEVNHSEDVRKNEIKVIKGTPSSSPSRPELIDDENVHQHILAYVYVEHEVTQITQDKITNMIGTTSTPFVTGILKTMNIDNLVVQWEREWKSWASKNQTEFLEWFHGLEDILDEETATHLQNEISALSASIENTYNKETYYVPGNFTMYKCTLYKCIAPTQGEWDESKWERTYVMKELNTAKVIIQSIPQYAWHQKFKISQNGIDTESSVINGVVVFHPVLGGFEITCGDDFVIRDRIDNFIEYRYDFDDYLIKTGETVSFCDIYDNILSSYDLSEIKLFGELPNIPELTKLEETFTHADKKGVIITDACEDFCGYLEGFEWSATLNDLKLIDYSRHVYPLYRAKNDIQNKLFFCFLLFNNAYNASSASYTLSLPAVIDGNYTVDWGDGYVEQNGVSHNYSGPAKVYTKFIVTITLENDATVRQILTPVATDSGYVTGDKKSSWWKWKPQWVIICTPVTESISSKYTIAFATNDSSIKTLLFDHSRFDFNDGGYYGSYWSTYCYTGPNVFLGDNISNVSGTYMANTTGGDTTNYYIISRSINSVLNLKGIETLNPSIISKAITPPATYKVYLRNIVVSDKLKTIEAIGGLTVRQYSNDRTVTSGYFFDDLKWIDFRGDNNVEEIKAIEKYASQTFSFNLTEMNFPKLRQISSSFSSVPNLKVASLPLLNVLPNDFFKNAPLLENFIISDNCNSIGTNAFYTTNLKEFDFKNLSAIPNGVLKNAPNLERIIGNSITKIGDDCIANSPRFVPDRNLLSRLTSIGSNSLIDVLVTELVMPNITSIGANSFKDCGIEFLDIGSETGTYNLNGCFSGFQNFKNVISRPVQVPTISANIFGTNKVIGEFIILVPITALSSYQSATNWSTYKNFFDYIK